MGTFFVIFIIPETKGKTMDEIQEMLGAGSDLTPSTAVNASTEIKDKY